MLKRWLLAVLIVSSLYGAAFSETRPFAELWNNVSYYDTNIQSKGFSSVLGRFEGKLGLYLFDTPFQAYGAYYVTASQTSNYWDNALYYGYGLRFKPLEGYRGSGWYNEWIRDVKVFAESLSSTFLKDAAPSGEARSDIRYGLDLWHEWNLDKPDLTNYWGEVWSNLSFRSTNFSSTDFNGYIFSFQPKIGKHLGHGIEAYLKTDITLSDKSSYWLNVADYGLGIRFEPWRETTDKDSLLKKFKMFAEVLSVSYLRDKPTDPNKNVASDVRFGIDFSYGR